MNHSSVDNDSSSSHSSEEEMELYFSGESDMMESDNNARERGASEVTPVFGAASTKSIISLKRNGEERTNNVLSTSNSEHRPTKKTRPLPVWKQYYKLNQALEQIKKEEDTSLIIVAFDLNSEHKKIYVITTPEEAIRVCLEKRRMSSFNCECAYELIHHCLGYMRLYCDAEYYIEVNPGKDCDEMKEALLDYIVEVYQELSSSSSSSLDAEKIKVETCHREEKVSFHFKIPKEFGVVSNMEDQKRFWNRVNWRIDQDRLNNDNPQLQNRANCLFIILSTGQKSSMIDMKVYGKSCQLMRILGACMKERER